MMDGFISGVFIGLILISTVLGWAIVGISNSKWETYLVNNDLAHYDAHSATIILNKTNEPVYK